MSPSTSPPSSFSFILVLVLVPDPHPCLSDRVASNHNTLPEPAHLTKFANPFTLLLYNKKISGMEVGRTQAVMLRFVVFNFSHFQ